MRQTWIVASGTGNLRRRGTATTRSTGGRFDAHHHNDVHFQGNASARGICAFPDPTSAASWQHQKLQQPSLAVRLLLLFGWRRQRHGEHALVGGPSLCEGLVPAGGRWWQWQSRVCRISAAATAAATGSTGCGVGTLAARTRSPRRSHLPFGGTARQPSRCGVPEPGIVQRSHNTPYRPPPRKDSRPRGGGWGRPVQCARLASPGQGIVRTVGAGTGLSSRLARGH